VTGVAILGVGLATARGGVDELAEEVAPAEIPWPLRAHAASRRYRPARGVAEAPGPARVAALIERALAACEGEGPIVVGTCNGMAAAWRAEDWRASFELGALGAGMQWGGRVVAVASAACASGLHALHLARCLLAAGAPEVTVVAVDIVTAPSHDNFEVLRVLADEPAPFQPEAAGFQLGEAAVALRLGRIERGGRAPAGAAWLVGPALGHDLDGDDGVARCLAALGERGARAGLVIGQGAGPAAGDRAELAAIAAHVPADVPLATALGSLGHTLGASSLLSVALAALATGAAGARAAAGAVAALAAPAAAAMDGRPLGGRAAREVIAVCRALGGAAGACAVSAAAPDLDGAFAGSPGAAEEVGAGSAARAEQAGAAVRRGRAAGDEVGAAAAWRVPAAWGPRSVILPLRDPVLRRIAGEAAAARPAEPPGLLIATLEAPLQPAARIGARILPTSVLEMTPGFVPQLVARAWGYRGPAICLVGGDPGPMLAACRAAHERVYRIAIRGMDERDVEWDA
jgi:hypothetical protein